MAIPTLDSHFADYPLTKKERKKGRALRVVCCLRSNEGAERFCEGPVSHFFIVLTGARGRGGSPAAPHCTALFGDKRVPSSVKRVPSTHLARHERDFGEDGIWTFDEYSFCVPVGAQRLLFNSGLLVLKVGRADQRRLLDDYYRSIAHAGVDSGYEEWLRRSAEKRRRAHGTPADGPLMSIVTPAYRTPPAMLRQMIESVVGQNYSSWELVIVNASPNDEEMQEVLKGIKDERIKVIDQHDNLGISGNTNVGIKACSGEYVSFLDHDDVIEPDALAEYVRVIEEREGDVGLLYCDEDYIDEHGRYSLPTFKPDYNPALLESQNYVCHWLTVRRDLLYVVGLFDGATDGSQDYDMTLKIADLGQGIVHVPHVLYHWRAHSGSVAGDPASKLYAIDAGKLALRHHLERLGLSGAVEDGPAPYTYCTRKTFQDVPSHVVVVCDGPLSAVTHEALASYASKHGIELDFVTSLREALAFDEAPDDSIALILTPWHDIDAVALEELLACVLADDVLGASPRVARLDGLTDYANCHVRPDGTIGRLLRFIPACDGAYSNLAWFPYDASVLNSELCAVSLSCLCDVGVDWGYVSLEYQLGDVSLRARERGLRSLYYPRSIARLNVARTVLGDAPLPPPPADVCRLIGGHPEYAEWDRSSNPNLDPWGAYFGLRR